MKKSYASRTLQVNRIPLAADLTFNLPLGIVAHLEYLAAALSANTPLGDIFSSPLIARDRVGFSFEISRTFSKVALSRPEKFVALMVNRYLRPEASYGKCEG